MKMRKSIIVMSVLLGCLMMTDGWAQEMSTDSFDELKKLEGEWKGTKPDGKSVTVTYKIMSGGSAMVETLRPGDESSMVTVYHRNGDKLMMTHYCSSGNQPRMIASNFGDGEIDFQFVDVSNLKSKSEGHMRGLKIIFEDENHFSQVWTWSESGKRMPATFKYERVM